MSKSIREKYNIPLDAKIILYVGNISENKNQRQLIESFSMMPPKLCEITYVLFCGDLYDDPLNLKQLICSTPYSNHLIICGIVRRDEMQKYYQEGDAVVLLSYAEGFGLSLIEGMYFGLPCMMFSDIDAFEDIYNENVAIAINNRSNKAVVEGLNHLLTNKWDKEYIKTYSQKFCIKEMAKNYVISYNKILKK